MQQVQLLHSQAACRCHKQQQQQHCACRVQVLDSKCGCAVPNEPRCWQQLHSWATTRRRRRVDAGVAACVPTTVEHTGEAARLPCGSWREAPSAADEPPAGLAAVRALCEESAMERMQLLSDAASATAEARLVAAVLRSSWDAPPPLVSQRQR